MNKVKFRSTVYLKWVAGHGCLICRGAAVPHHLLRVEGKGTGTRSGDNWAIPLCDKHHKELHASGDEVGYLDRFGIDGPDRARRLFAAWPKPGAKPQRSTVHSSALPIGTPNFKPPKQPKRKAFR